ncbi:hypothetical protein ACFWYA_13010 [Streptomyces sp. NPDC059011]
MEVPADREAEGVGDECAEKTVGQLGCGPGEYEFLGGARRGWL